MNFIVIFICQIACYDILEEEIIRSIIIFILIEFECLDKVVNYSFDSFLFNYDKNNDLVHDYHSIQTFYYAVKRFILVHVSSLSNKCLL